MALSGCEACGAAVEGEPTECEGCDEAMPSPGEIRRLPHQVVLGFLEHAEAFLAASPLQQFVLAFAAGSFVTFGALLSVLLTVGVEPIGLSRLLLGLGFSAGFVMIILSGSALFTEINVLLPELFLVMATQNPIEQEGTYPLPEAQLDRFLMHVNVDYPAAADEHRILALVRSEFMHRKLPEPPALLKQDTIFAFRHEILGL